MLFRSGTITWLRPDSKSQVSVVYEGNRPVRIDNVVVSHQHDDGVSYDEIKETIINEIINPVLGESNLLLAAWDGEVSPSLRTPRAAGRGDGVCCGWSLRCRLHRRWPPTAAGFSGSVTCARPATRRPPLPPLRRCAGWRSDGRRSSGAGTSDQQD